MGSRLSKNILQIELIESGSLAKFWSDWRSVTKVIENLRAYHLYARLKNILQIGLIESGSLAKFWSSVTKVIANFLTPF